MKQDLTRIAQAINDCKNDREVERFLRAFLTPAELKTLVQRYQLIELLLQKVPQREISKRLGISISQISRGSAELQFGTGAKVFPKIFKNER